MPTRQFLTPSDADYDDMHHALGRPAGAHETPYRNYFVCAAVGDQADRFAVLGSYWLRAGLINGDHDAIYRVTPEGQRQVMAWLSLKNLAAGKRPWLVSGAGLQERIVIAKSPSAAKYDVWLQISDVVPGGFGEFLKSGVRARAA